ncbi:hypothetical protein HHK36_004335 [Tetracentron sinense]|uniref:Coenzyme Q-binding protein COQ10 START domain-containing protein n=1 Tax=Tetracentron sinense TaxID=13715 RepID=A0A834ZQZ8_TETSI|nr:hypothetical protein HHK36_004335 [Tetracentron sinense]
MISCNTSNFSFSSFCFRPACKRNPRNLGFLLTNHSLGNKCRAFSSIDRQKWNPRSRPAWDKSREEEDDEDREGERKVHCEVDVISWRERRIKATVLVYADLESVWNALTDYERLADFIPNLVCSGRIPCPHPGRIWLEQRGLQRALYWHIEARVVLDLQEFPNSVDSKEIAWGMGLQVARSKEVGLEVAGCKRKGVIVIFRSSTTTLSYEVNVIPRFNFPAIFLERIIRSDLPVNLKALACRAERKFKGNKKTSIPESTSDATSMAGFTSPSIDLEVVSPEKDKLSSGEFKENHASFNFGPLSPSSNEVNSNWGVFGKVCRLDRPCMVDEVHLRRFDGLLENGGVHRCVVASITVKAPVREVWNVLTSYETLPEIVPNLVISKILLRENNKVRILQGGLGKKLFLLILAKGVILSCNGLEREREEEEEEGEGDLLEEDFCLEIKGSMDSVSSYTVRLLMRKESIWIQRILSRVRRLIMDWSSSSSMGQEQLWKRYNDLISSLAKLQNYRLHNGTDSDHNKSTEQVSDFNSPIQLRQRPRVPGLQRDIEVLKSELMTFISEHGQEGFMPMRKQLRLHGRMDIEKAITRMGGFRKIASLMNLALAYKHRKPKGYWDNLENLQEEISRFQRSWGMDLTFMPSRKSFERAGRYDIARALEKWGGLHEVSRLLSLKVRHPNRQASLAKDKEIEDVATGDIEGEEKMPYKPDVSQDTQKWLMELKHLDINWVE